MYAEVQCWLYESHSLKQKRSVVKRITAKLRQELNVAVTELDYQDLWQRTKFGIVTVSTDKTHAEQVLQAALKLIDTFIEIERTITETERR
ncbi:DUF503 family protein [Barrientosiimonas marina]